MLGKLNIVLFTHPRFMESQSMPRFAHMLEEGLKARGHSVVTWTANAVFHRIPIKPLKKWLGYIDQFLIFPILVKQKIKRAPSDTLFVFSDHALGPWIPHVLDRPHVVHCHDLLAQYSATGKNGFPETRSTGKIYQWYIRRGFSKAKNFICVSENTKQNLLGFLPEEPAMCTVVYNGLNRNFEEGNKDISRIFLSKKISEQLLDGFIMHIGGNQWYKNREGVVDIYLAWRRKTDHIIPLLMIGKPLPASLLHRIKQSEFANEIIVLENANDEIVYHAYSGAEVLLYPSIAEGFGWPIAEAQACGCAVITTNKGPMNEVGGDAAVYIKPMTDDFKKTEWLKEAAGTLEAFLSLKDDVKQNIAAKGISNAKRFNTDKAINEIEALYLKLINSETN